VRNEGKVQDAEVLLLTLFQSTEKYNRTDTYSEIRFDLSEVNPVIVDV
jgi:hypothetical protein